MAVTRMLAQMTVADLPASITWYATLFGRDPDARPMDGLVEWHLSDAFGVQVWLQPDRAGASTMVLDESDLDSFVGYLDRTGITHDVPSEATYSRILPLEDPDGNRVVVTGSPPGAMTCGDTVRAMFEAYLAQDRTVVEALLAEHFVFTSPQDERIDKAAFLQRCFPTAARVASQELTHVVELPGDDVFIMYEYELKTGGRHRNTEVITVRDGQLTETQVFFGGKLGVS